MLRLLAEGMRVTYNLDALQMERERDVRGGIRFTNLEFDLLERFPIFRVFNADGKTSEELLSEPFEPFKFIVVVECVTEAFQLRIDPLKLLPSR